MTVAYPNPEELSCHLHEIACPHAEPIAHPLDPLSVGETPRRWVQLLGQLVAGVNRCIEVHKPLELQILRVLAEEQCVNCRLEMLCTAWLSEVRRKHPRASVFLSYSERAADPPSTKSG